MNILEFMDLYESCEVSARLCLSTLEIEYDDVSALNDDDYNRYQDFIRALSPQWLVRIYQQCEVVELEVLWSGFCGDEWEELIKLEPKFYQKKLQHYQAPRFFRN